MVYAIESAGTHGWTSTQTIVGSTISTVLLTAFWLIERHVPAPLVPPATWKIRSLMSASTVMAVITGGIVGAIFVSSLFLQQVLGASPVVTGLEFLPLAAAITLGAAVASHVIGHAARRRAPARRPPPPPPPPPPPAPCAPRPSPPSPRPPGSWPACPPPPPPSPPSCPVSSSGAWPPPPCWWQSQAHTPALHSPV